MKRFDRTEWLLIAAFGLAVCFQVDAPLLAQNYIESQLPDANWQNRSFVADMKLAKEDALSGFKPYTPESKLAVQRWYNDYYFRQMTWKSKEAELPEFRAGLLKDLRKIPDEERMATLRVDMLTMVSEKMWAVVQNNFSPAVRVNAMLLIGDLNARERNFEVPAPVPFQGSLRYLVLALKDGKLPEGVRLAALVGLLRHAESQWTPGSQPFAANVRDVIVSEMMTIVSEKAPPPTRTAAGHDWVRSRAVDVLGAMNTLGDQGAVFKKLEEIVGDTTAEPTLRCAAASALGRFDYSGIRADMSSALVKVAGLAADICESEADRLENIEKTIERRKAQATGGGGGGDGGGGGGGCGGEAPDAAGAAVAGGDCGGGLGAMGLGGAGGMGGLEAAKPDAIAHYFTDISRRRMRQRMLHLRMAISGVPGDQSTRKGLSALVPEAKKNLVIDATSALDSLLSLTDGEPRYEDLVTGYKKASSSFGIVAVPQVDPLAAPPAGEAPPAGNPIPASPIP